MSLAPIALFVFKRPEHTRRALEALARNAEFSSSELHVFCDGSRGYMDDDAVNATRAIVRLWKHPNKFVHESAKNMGLANAVITGVTVLCGKYESVIVVEDDRSVSCKTIGNPLT